MNQKPGTMVIKTFSFGIVLGIVGTIAALMYLPAVDQYREVSIIAVTPNGGNSEAFHVNIPMDRIMIGAADRDKPLPEGLQWPDDEMFNDARAELYKLRNSRDAVVGVASRLSASNEAVGDVIEWVLHLPARGSMYASLNTEPLEGRRTGIILAGTREFEDLAGEMEEHWVADSSESSAGPAGRIQLTSRFVSTRVQRVEGEVDEVEGVLDEAESDDAVERVIE